MSKQAIFVRRTDWRASLLLAITAVTYRSAPPAHAASDMRPSVDSISAYVPCAERLIVRNYGLSDRTLEVTVFAGDHASSRIAIRRRNPTSAIAYASAILPLPEGGAAGTVRDGVATVSFDSRNLQQCARSILDTFPHRVPEDYMFANTLLPRNEVGVNYPGLVQVRFTSPVRATSVDSLLRSYGAWIVGKVAFGGDDDLYYLWFDGDDESATVAAKHAWDFRKSALVRHSFPVYKY